MLGIGGPKGRGPLGDGARIAAIHAEWLPPPGGCTGPPRGLRYHATQRSLFARPTPTFGLVERARRRVTGDCCGTGVPAPRAAQAGPAGWRSWR